MRSISLIDFYFKNLQISDFRKSFEKLCIGEFLEISGVASSLDAIMFSYFCKTLQRADFPKIFIFDSLKSAEMSFSDFKLFTHCNIKFFPTIDKSPYNSNKQLLSNLHRNSVLCDLVEKNNTIIISHIDAVMQNVNEVSQGDVLRLYTNSEYNFTELGKQISQKGFYKVDKVELPGQFAIRGGIIDVFSSFNLNPYRLDFYGDTIDEITIFDVESQCSIEKVEQADIVIIKDEEELSKTIFDYLEDGSYVFFKNFDEKFVRSDQINLAEILKRFRNVVLQDNLHLNIDCNNQYRYCSYEQESLNNNFDYFVQAIKKNFEKGYDNIISVSSEVKSQRICSLLESYSIDEVMYSISREKFSTGFVDENLKISFFTDHQVFGEVFDPKVYQNVSKISQNSVKKFRQIEVGDYIVHKDFGIGKFAGLTTKNDQEVIRLIYKDNDIIHVSLQSLHKISKYKSKDDQAPVLTKLGTSNWENKKSKVKSRLKSIAQDLIQIYSKRRETKGFVFSADTALQLEMESSFMYTDTVDQASAMISIKKDMESDFPMDRLICGDVGFGKTELAIRAAFKATQDLKQVAVLVPTTILSYQHYESFCKRLTKFGTKIEFVSRFKSAKEIKNILERLKNGDIDIIIGTHKLLSKDVFFADLGLLIVDEEQKFGVAAKERIKELKFSVDILTLTATPIPRTLNFALLGAKDFNLITTPPSNRQPIDTHVCKFDKKIVEAAISNEFSRNGQILFVHNRVSDIESIANKILAMVPRAEISIIHGQMPAAKLERSIFNFIEKKTNVLLATSIIESGVDIPNANTLIVNDSHMFGLSDLHQMRGRVGRSNKKAYCYLIAPPLNELNEEAKQRLSTLVEFSNLGDGFKIAMRDLDIRGAGDLLGAEQSGFISDIGFETFCEILDEAMSEVKSADSLGISPDKKDGDEKFLVKDCIIEVDIPAYIPEIYVSSSSERIELYRRIDEIYDEVELQNFFIELEDRFGAIPIQTMAMKDMVYLRWEMMVIGVDEVYMDKKMCRVSFSKISLDSKIDIQKIFNYVHKNSRYSSIQHTESKLQLICKHINNLDDLKLIINSFRLG